MRRSRHARKHQDGKRTKNCVTIESRHDALPEPRSRLERARLTERDLRVQKTAAKSRSVSVDAICRHGPTEFSPEPINVSSWIMLAMRGRERSYEVEASERTARDAAAIAACARSAAR